MTVDKVLERLMDDGAAPPEMLVAHLASVPNGEEAGDAQKVIRGGKALHPLALQKH